MRVRMTPLIFQLKKVWKFGENIWKNSWFALYDKIIVATQYHKDLLIKTRSIDPQKFQ